MLQGLGNLALLLLCGTVCADVYMHAPRGSNDRNCEKNVNRNNGNRLFDSQNNAKGGYACPRPRIGSATAVDKMYYHPGSKTVIEWTNQHGCGANPKTHCEIVIQYACEDTLDAAQQYRRGESVGSPRDGLPTNANDAATDTIPENEESAIASTPTSLRFGMHESFDFYQKCKQRSSNFGLYTSDQRLNRGAGSRATRQNPNGNRRGLECPEERDYYPYWAPSPWRDIAVITANPERCDYYKAASQNVKPRGECVAAEDFYPKNHIYESKCRVISTANQQPAADKKAQGKWYNNQQECVSAGHKWVPAWYDLKHPASLKLLEKAQKQTVKDTTGKMHYEVFDALAESSLCNTKANVALEQGAKEVNVALNADNWEVRGLPPTFNKDGTVSLNMERYDAKKPADDGYKGNFIFSKTKFRGPVKIEVKFREGAEVTRSDCFRVHVFPRGGSDPKRHWINGLGGRSNQFGALGWGGKELFTQPEGGRQTRFANTPLWTDLDKKGCLIKLPTGCAHGNKDTADRYTAMYKDFAMDGDGRAKNSKEACDKRKADWDTACKVEDTEVKYNPMWAAQREDQTVQIEVWSNKTATYTYNGQWVTNIPYPDAMTEGVIALSGCSQHDVKSVKVTQAGIYGQSTAGCQDNLRKAMVGDAREPHTYGASFSGEASDCGGRESSRKCTKALCPDAKIGKGTPRVQRLSGYFVPTATGSFQFSAKGAYGMELWLNDKKLIVNTQKNGAVVQAKTETLQANTGYRLQAFSIAEATTEAGCFVRVSGGCTKQVDQYRSNWGDSEAWVRDWHGEAGSTAHHDEARCKSRKRDFDNFCGVTTSEMKFQPIIDGDMKIGVKAGNKNYPTMKTFAPEYKVCTKSNCGEPERQCQTKATEECECDTWKTRAPAKWALGAEAGNCCMRPTYDRKQGPWCYCKNKKGGEFASCKPEFSAHKGKLELIETEDSWAEADDVSLVQEEASAAVGAPITGPTGTTDDSPATETVDCRDGLFSSSRENQLGNAINSANPDNAIPHVQNANRYIWTVPDHIQQNCVIRLRYNISTSDYADWASDGTPLTTSAQNAKLGGDPQQYLGPDGKPTTSPIMQDPYVGIGPDPSKTFLSLAVNTNQYGRTFQDRSYVFAIKPRPAKVDGEDVTKDANIYNVNVRGKRGNIVQTYPAVEYDFVPNDLCAQVGDYVHFQWTGSDYNPQRNPNDGEGGGDSTDPNEARRADRTNLVEMDTNGNTIKFPVSEKRVNNEGPYPESWNQTGAGQRVGDVALGMNYPAGALGKWDSLATDYTGMFWTKDNKPDEAAIMNLAFINQVERMAKSNSRCKTLDELNAVPNQDSRERDPANCAKLNGAKEPYFDGGLVKLRKAGQFSYFSSRNNNFSNRNQAGCICVGQKDCNSQKGCQRVIGDDLRSRLKREKASGKLLEMESAAVAAQPKQAACDEACVAALRAQVESLNQQVETLKSGL